VVRGCGDYGLTVKLINWREIFDYRVDLKKMVLLLANRSLMFKIVGVVSLAIAGSLLAYGVLIRLPSYYLVGPDVSSISIILSSVFVVCGFVFYFDVPSTTSRQGKIAATVLGASLVMFVTAVVLGAYYWWDYEYDLGRWVSVPAEGRARQTVWVVPMKYVYPYATLSTELFIVSVACFLTGLVLKFRDSGVF
jgi:hypothetical protein